MKKLLWLGSSQKDLMKFPREVKQEVGYALYQAQLGEYYKKVKPFKGCGPGVYEIALAYNTDAYRAVYLVTLKTEIYVVHCFQKKAKKGIKTPQEEINVIKQRIKFLKAP